MTEPFASLTTNLFMPIKEDYYFFNVLQRYVVIMYSKSSYVEYIIEDRKEFFCQNNKTKENLPPTTDALLQHMKTYLASIYSYTVILFRKGNQHLDRYANNQWTPVWITLSANDACLNCAFINYL